MLAACRFCSGSRDKSGSASEGVESENRQGSIESEYYY